MSNRSELSRKRINRDKSRSSVKSDFGTPCILLLHLINPKSVSELRRKEISKLLSAVLRLSFIFCVSGSLIRNKWIQVISFFTSATLFILSFPPFLCLNLMSHLEIKKFLNNISSVNCGLWSFVI